MADTTADYEAKTTTSPLRIYRVAAGLTQQQLALLAGCTRVTVGALERGENHPRRRTARALAVALGVEVEQLFGDQDGQGA